MILVDSNIWIEFWSAGSSESSIQLRDLIEQDKAAINGLIYTEILQSSPSIHEFKKIESFLEIIPILSFDENHWHKTARFYFEMKKKGLTVTTIDCLIAMQAIEENIPLFSKDKIFEKMKNHTNLKIYHQAH